MDCFCCTVVGADYGDLLPGVINGLFPVIELVAGLVHSEKNKPPLPPSCRREFLPPHHTAPPELWSQERKDSCRKLESLKLLTLKEGLVLADGFDSSGQPMRLGFQEVAAGTGFLRFPDHLIGIVLGEN